MYKFKLVISCILDFLSSGPFLCIFSFVLSCFSAVLGVPAFDLVLAGSIPPDPMDLTYLFISGLCFGFFFDFLLDIIVSCVRKSSGKEPAKSQEEKDGLNDG